MHFQITKNELLKGLRNVNRAISNRVTIPVLSGMLFQAENGVLTITGSDSHLSVKINIESDNSTGLNIFNEGSIILPAKEIVSIINLMPENLILFESDGDNVKIKSGKAVYTLNGTKADEYPRLPNDNGEEINVNVDDLVSVLEKTEYAVSQSETRPVLTGVNLFFEEDSFGAVATDAHRLSRFDNVRFEGELKEISNLIIPGDTVKQIPHLLKGKQEVGITIDNNIIVFKAGNTTVFSRLLEGEYPETDRLIPEGGDTKIIVNRDDFIATMERSMILGSDRHTSHVTFKIGGSSDGMFDTIELNISADELGSSSEEILVKEVEGEEVIINFNAKYMLDALSKIDDMDVELNFNGNMRPFTLKPINKKQEDDFVQIILPVRNY